MTRRIGAEDSRVASRMRILRFFRNLLLHALLVRPACGCGMFTMCLACPEWKLAIQHRYHEEGAAGLHPLPL